MKLIVDVGNTQSKLALVTGEELQVQSLPDGKFSSEILQSFFDGKNFPRAAIIAAVADFDKNIEAFLTSKNCRVFLFDASLKIPVEVLYETPHTLGNDRLANVCALSASYPGQAALCIDCGTCIKMDMIDEKGRYFGGSISPGLHMRYKALHQFTHSLPALEAEPDATLIGKSTAASIHSGVVNGLVSEIDGMIKQYELLFPEIKKVITGGDHALLAGKLKNSIFVAPNLTMHGLKVILDHNL